jgi:ferredoxin
VEPNALPKQLPDTEPDRFWLKLNADYAKSWPNITSKKAPPPDGKEFDGRPTSLLDFFSPAWEGD